MLVFTTLSRLRPLSSRRWTAPSNSCRKQRPLWKRSRTLNVKEFRSWRSRQLFYCWRCWIFFEDFCWGCDLWWKYHHIQHEKSNGLSMFAAVFRWMLWLKLKWRCNPWRRRRKRPYFGKHQTDHGSKIKNVVSRPLLATMKNRFRVSHVSEHGVWQKGYVVFQRLRSQHRLSLKIKMTSWWASSFERRARNPQSCSFGIHEFHPHGNHFRVFLLRNGCIFLPTNGTTKYAILVGYSKLRCLCSETVFSWTNWVVNGKAKSKNIAINEGACDPWNLNQWRK